MKRTIFLLITFILLALPLGYVSAQLPNLEIIYPRIPGDQTPPTVISEGLPDYVNYIYYFFFAIIGIIVLGALIYNGIIYLTSVGSPDKLMSAKKGIVAAFLGAIILFSSWFVFRSINPQLVVLEAPAPEDIEPIVTPGIYLCNYKPDNVSGYSVRGSIEKYIYGDEDERISGAKELKEIMKKKNDICFRVNRSANLVNFEFDQNLHDIFVIPWIDYEFDPENPSELMPKPINDYGLIFHEKDNFLGKYDLAVIYPYDIAHYPDFISRSVTLFQKPKQEPSSSNLGVVLYQCLDYNEGGFCPEDLKGDPDARSFPMVMPGDNLTRVAPADLGPNLRAKFKDAPRQGGTPFYPITYYVQVPDGPTGTRSIKIDPIGSYFALLFNGEHFGNDSTLAEVISDDDPNLLDNKIGQCGAECRMVSDNNMLLKNCGPCLKSMIVIKGEVIK